MKKVGDVVLVLLILIGAWYLAYFLPSQMLREALVTPSNTKVTPSPLFPTGTPSPTEVTPQGIIITVQSVYVHIRSDINSVVIGALYRGDIVSGTCIDYWCKVTDGFVWRGCTSDNPDKLGCEER